MFREKVCQQILPIYYHAYIDSLQIQLEERGPCMVWVYNADETVLCWKAVPRRTLVAAFEQSASGRKQSKQRVSILVCCNTTGSHELKPLLIGKSTHIVYRHQSNMWMTQEMFSQLLHDHLAKFSLPLKTLSLVDNCSAHPRNLMSEDGAIHCEFLPPNVTSLLQPFDHSVIDTAKC